MDKAPSEWASGLTKTAKSATTVNGKYDIVGGQPQHRNNSSQVHARRVGWGIRLVARLHESASSVGDPDRWGGQLVGSRRFILYALLFDVLNISSRRLHSAYI